MDKIVDYIMDFVFEKKATKAECISNMNSLFNGKADVMMDYLWNLTKDIENSSESDYNRRKSWKSSKNRDRSRSYSNERTKNKFNYSKYQSNMIPRGFYPPKMRYGASMMPYAPNMPRYMVPNPMIQR